MSEISTQSIHNTRINSNSKVFKKNKSVKYEDQKIDKMSVTVKDEIIDISPTISPCKNITPL